MLNQGNLISAKAVTAITNFWSGGGAAVKSLATPMDVIKGILSGALTADTYKEILAISGSGVIDICFAISKDATSRVISLKVVIDGITAFDAASASFAQTNCGIIAIGVTGDGALIVPEPMVFNESLSISVKSSLSETDKVALHEQHYLT